MKLCPILYAKFLLVCKALCDRFPTCLSSIILPLFCYRHTDLYVPQLGQLGQPPSCLRTFVLVVISTWNTLSKCLYVWLFVIQNFVIKVSSQQSERHFQTNPFEEAPVSSVPITSLSLFIALITVWNYICLCPLLNESYLIRDVCLIHISILST